MGRLAFLLLSACTHTPRCADVMLTHYGDLGAESSSGYEQMTGTEAHYAGVAWAAEFMKECER